MGDYDTLMEPKVITKGWDYICITNNKKIKEKSGSVWKVFYTEDRKLSDSKLARKCKMLFWEMSVLKFRRYSVNIWHDANIQINCDLNKFIEKRNDDFYIMSHPDRVNALDEVNFCIKRKKSDERIIQKQMQQYIKDGFPDNIGLCASGLMIRRDTPAVRRLMKLWFDQVLKYSERDQVSFNYALWKRPTQVNYIPFNTIITKFIKRAHKKLFEERKKAIEQDIEKILIGFINDHKILNLSISPFNSLDGSIDTKISYEI